MSTPRTPTPALRWMAVACSVVSLWVGTSAVSMATTSTVTDSLASAAPFDSLRGERDPSTILETLVQQVSRQVIARYERPWGRVVERRRSRVFVVPQGAAPERGDTYLVMRRVAGMNPPRERLICRLRVQRVAETLVECKEMDRAGDDHAEDGDLVREENVSLEVMLAPCISTVDLAPVIPQVVGESLRSQLQGRPTIRLAEDLDAERQVEEAYWSGTMPAFLAQREGIDVVLVPVLLRSEERLILNVEYHSVERRTATDIDVGSVPLNEMLLSWLRAGRTRDFAPPGFRSLPAQTFDWQLFAMEGLPGGRLVAVLRDSVRVFEFAYPGLRQTHNVALPPRDRVRQYPYIDAIRGDVLAHIANWASRQQQPVAMDVAPLQMSRDVLWLVSDERRPTTLDLSRAANDIVDARSAPIVDGLSLLWTLVDGPKNQARRWWPTPGGKHAVVAPRFLDVDDDGVPDLLWSNDRGAVQLRRRGQEVTGLDGFGDVKSVQQPQDASSRTVVWLTDPVWDGAGDRLSAIQFSNGRLRPVWQSKRFQNTLVAVASVDLNRDTAIDLVVAEQLPSGTRLHLFLALPGENTATRGGPWSE